jgi:hypothetical protein
MTILLLNPVVFVPGALAGKSLAGFAEGACGGLVRRTAAGGGAEEACGLDWLGLFFLGVVAAGDGC